MLSRTIRSHGRSTLWSNRNFLNLWSAETIAQFGMQLGIVAIPLIAALTLDASPLQMGILAAAGQIPRLVIGFIVGAWVDRLRKQPIMLAMDIGRALTYAVIPAAALMDVLSFWLLFTVALVAGIQTVVFDAAWSSTIPQLVKRKELPDATGKLVSSVSLAQVMGPALAGTLMSWFTGPIVMGLTAASFAGSGWFIGRIRNQEVIPDRNGENATRLLQEIQEGFHELWRTHVLRSLAISSVVLNLGSSMFFASYVLFMTNDLGFGEGRIGLILASGGAGALLGSFVAAPLGRRFGIGQTILWGAIGLGVSNILVPLAIFIPDLALVLLIVSEVAAWSTVQVFNINRFSLRQALTPQRLMGRITSSTLTLIGAASLVGSLTGGLIGEVFSVHIALYISVVVMFLAAWWVWDSPVPQMREIPGEEEEALTAAKPATA